MLRQIGRGSVEAAEEERTMIKWGSYLDTGIALIDRHHREPVRWIDLLIDAMLSGHGEDKITGLLDFLADCTEFHFGTEERIMLGLEFPQRETHVQEHDGFRRRLQETPRPHSPPVGAAVNEPRTALPSNR